MAVWDVEAVQFVAVNRSALASFGYTREAFLALSPMTIRPPEDRERFAEWLRARSTRTSESFRKTGQWRYVRADGAIVELEIAQSRQFLYRDRPAYLVIYFDIAEARRTTERIRTGDALREAVDDLEEMQTFHYDLRTGTYQGCAALAQLLGPANARTGGGAESFAHVLLSPEQARVTAAFLESFDRREPYSAEYALLVGGDLRWYRSRTRIAYDDDGVATHIVGVTIDITERRRMADIALADVRRDVQTGLPTPAAVQTDGGAPARLSGVILVRTKWVVVAAKRSDDTPARCAAAIAAMLNPALPADALLVRYADDVFAVVVPAVVRLRPLLPLAKKLLAALDTPVALGDDEFVVSASAGVACASDDLPTVADLFRRAECALESAPEAVNRVAVYDEALGAMYDRRATIDRHLRHAIVDRRIDVAYQPIVSLRTGTIVAAEALMRWDCPGLGPVPPAEFIAVAEDTGAIIRLGEWIMREACVQARRWELAGFRLRISINVSARQVQQRDFVKLVCSTCALTSVDPSRLDLEVTESLMLQPDGVGPRNLQALRRLGVRISIDDFGTGYSSLSYLKHLPIDTVKVDRSFVMPIVEDDFEADITRSVISIAHRRDLNVIAEGVESPDHAAALQRMNCDEAQGYLFGRPCSSHDFLTLLQRERVGSMLAAAGGTSA